MYYDLKFFEAINNLSGQSKTADYAGVFFADYLPYILGMFLLILLFYPRKNIKENRAMVVVSVIAALVARFGVKTILVLFYARPRPYVNLDSTHKLITLNPIENFQSFPSGHTLFFFALSTVIYSFNKKLGVIFFIFSTLIAIARIFVGVHWPSDILVGILLGIVVGFIINWLYNKAKTFLTR
jgi:undecaprenyl-diphosphatase